MSTNIKYNVTENILFSVKNGFKFGERISGKHISNLENIKFDGFLSVYNNIDKTDSDTQQIINEYKVGDLLKLSQILSNKFKIILIWLILYEFYTIYIIIYVLIYKNYLVNFI